MVSYMLDVQQDEIDVRGNALASGDDAEDQAAEDAILARLNDGDVWAWAVVTVRAKLVVDGVTFVGMDMLGGCSYADEADFRTPGGYYDDMRQQALDDLKARLVADVQRAKTASKALRLLGSAS